MAGGVACRRHVVIPYYDGDGVEVWYKLAELPAGSLRDAVRAVPGAELTLVEKEGTQARSFELKADAAPVPNHAPCGSEVPAPPGLSIWRTGNSTAFSGDGDAWLRAWFAESARLATSGTALWRIDGSR